jgi:ABC-type sulfate transport system permease subunit
MFSAAFALASLLTLLALITLILKSIIEHIIAKQREYSAAVFNKAAAGIAEGETKK